MDGGTLLGADFAASLHLERLHGDEGAELVGLELLLHGQFLAILDVHGVPEIGLG